MPTIVFAQYAYPYAYPPIEHACDILADAGFDVLSIGTTGVGSSQAISAAQRPRITMQLRPSVAPGLRQKADYAAFLAEVVSAARRSDCLAVYCSDLLATPAGLVCHRMLGKPVLYHEHDPVDRTRGVVASALMSARAHVAAEAAMCIIPNEERRRAFAAELKPRASLTVWNCPSRTEVRQVPPEERHRGFVLWYHGSIVPTQLPLAVVDALAQLPDEVELHFAGYGTAGHVGYIDALLARATDKRVKHRVKYLGVIPAREAMLGAATRCHLGLALFAKPFRAPMFGASNKPWEYVACGLPVLASDAQEWADWIANEEVGATCDPTNADEIAAAVRWVRLLPDAGARAGNRGRERVAQGSWNYESQFAPVAAMLKDLARGKWEHPD